MILRLREDLKRLSNSEKGKFLQRFFKTGEGQYGYGDIFLGLAVPQSRQLALKYKDLTFTEIKELLKSKIHEERLIGLLILVNRFQKGDDETKKKSFDFYLKNTKYVNNWDLVDLSADKIVGEFLQDKPTDILVDLAKSESIWERRIAIISTYAFIKRGKSDLTFKIVKILINDKHDLIQKAVGWMLREVGKRVSREKEEKFLKVHYKTMPRTTLRYAIEHFEPKVREKYLKGTI